MPEFYRQLLIWGGLSTLVLWMCRLIIGRTMHVVRNRRFLVDAALRPVFPTDPRIPGGARWFFSDVWAQLQSLGFQPAVYLRLESISKRQATFLMMFEHPFHQDGAAATISFEPGPNGPLSSTSCVEFSTESPEGVDVTTSNYARANIFPALSSDRAVRVPGMRDLAALYKIHGLHFAESGVRSKRIFPAPLQLPVDMQNATNRRYTQLAELGAVRFAEEGRLVGLNWRCALRAVWGLMPINRRLWLMLARRRAARWLKRHGMSGRYERVDYERSIAAHNAFAGELPIPDWYPPADETVDRWFRSCEACRSRITADRPDCDAVTCPSCGLKQTPTDESPLIAFDLAPQQPE